MSDEQSAAACREALAKADALVEYVLLIGQAQGVLMYACGLDPQQAMATFGSCAARDLLPLEEAARRMVADLFAAKPNVGDSADALGIPSQHVRQR